MSNPTLDLALNGPLNALQNALREAVSGAVGDVVLPGVEVKVYKDFRDWWHASILLDRQTYPEPPVRVGNRPLVDDPSQRWWYDPIATTTDFDAPVDSPERERTSEQAYEALIAEVTDLLLQIAAFNLRKPMEELARASVRRR